MLDPKSGKTHGTEMRDWHQLLFTLHLESDLHSGTGQGYLTTIDDLQSRNHLGAPVIWGSVLRGLLRNELENMAQIDQQLQEACFGVSEEFISDIMGREVDKPGNVLVRSLHFNDPDSLSHLPNFTTVTSTSRQVHSRMPEEGTLRTLEFARRGLQATGEIRCWATDAECQLIRVALSRITHIGSRRSRGQGKIKITEMKSHRISSEPLNAKKTCLPDPGKGENCLRVLLRNLEPLCLTATAIAGNEIPTWNFISGSTLRGGIFTALAQLGVPKETIDRWVFDQLVAIDFVYPIATEIGSIEKIDIFKCQSIPIPLSAKEPKATASVDPSAVPWWANPTTASSVGYDSLTKLGSDELGVQVEEKRVKSNDYLITWDACTWHRLGPREVSLMRNRTPVQRFHRSSDSRSPMANGEELFKSSLFTEAAVGEDQLWICSVRCKNDQVAAEFSKAFALLLSKEKDKNHWIRIGRGGRPMIVEKAVWLSTKTNEHVGSNSNEHLNICLTSDLIARDPWFMYCKELNLDCLECLIPEVAKLTGSLEIVSSSTSEPTTVRTFRTRAGVRAADVIGIRRGSTLRLKGPVEAISQLKQLLQQYQVTGFGERTSEGFGKFVIDSPIHDVHWTREPDSLSSTSDHNPNIRIWNEREKTLDAVLGTKRESGRSLADLKRSQWQQLRHDVEAIPQSDSSELAVRIKSIMKQLGDHSKIKAGQAWNAWLPSMESNLKKLSEPRFQRDYLIYLCRWKSSQLLSETESENESKETAL